MPSISTHNLGVCFGNKQVLSDVNLEVPAATSTVILGGSGSGKSVLLKAIIGLISTKSGSIIINGQKNLPGHITPSCGMLFQNGALFDSLPVWRNIIFGMHKGLFSDKKLKNRAVELLSMVDLGPEIADMYPESLSGGMKKRVALARTIALNPHAILFDEPTTGLDPITAEIINKLIIKLIRDLAVTAITVTHDINSALTIADNIAMIEAGKIRWAGTKSEFLTSDDRLGKSFLLSSGVRIR